MLVKTLLYCMKIENLVNFSSGNRVVGLEPVCFRNRKPFSCYIFMEVFRPFAYIAK